MPKILVVDIETTPNLAWVWGLFKQNVAISQIAEAGEVTCFAAKWVGDENVMFYSTFHDGKDVMLDAAYVLLSDADIVVSYNGIRFDMPHLNREFIQAGKTPPSPYAQVDLLRTVRKQFKFPSNKLDYVSQALGLGAKQTHSGFQLWLDCMAEDEEAWALMQEYNEQDVRLTEDLYVRLLPWISPHPSLALYTPGSEAEDFCPNCGSDNLKRQGYAHTQVSTYQRYKCGDCGKWSRSSHRVSGVTVRGTA